jgi:hypothetical protein
MEGAAQLGANTVRHKSLQPVGSATNPKPPPPNSPPAAGGLVAAVVLSPNPVPAAHKGTAAPKAGRIGTEGRQLFWGQKTEKP